MAITLDGTNGITTETGTGDVSVGDDLIFTGTGNRITGDFSNTTIANRVIFQSSTTNGVSAITAMPNGTATTASFQAFNTNDPANTSITQVLALSTESSFRNAINGTGTYLPMTFYTNGSERMRIDTSGNALVGTTTTAGSSSNNANLIAGIFSSLSGTTGSIANGASADIVTSTANTSFYQVFANAVGNTTVFASALIYFNGAGAATVQSIMGTGMSIGSGTNKITVTNSAGSSQEISWRVIRYK